jgi:hypothetical protein
MARKPKLPEFAELNPTEAEWVAKHADDAPELIEHLTGEDVAGEVTVEQLDAAWAGFLQIAEENPQAVNPVVNILGVAFGQILVRDHDMKWVVATDRYGTDIALLGQPGDLVVYPTNAVAKRWESRETGFFRRLELGLVEAQARQPASGPD